MTDTWILYKTTNLINGKIYVGVHKLADTSKSRNYIGSGLSLKLAIEKYGRKNFTRATLAEFNSIEEAYIAEAELVTQEFVNQEDTYNISLGGRGGGIQTPEIKAKISAANKGNTYNIGRKHSEESRAKISERNKGKPKSEEHKAKMSSANIGKKHSAETRLKLSAAKYKPVVINGRYFISLIQAAEFNKITYPSVRWRVQSLSPQWIDWRFATEEEIANFSAREVSAA
jgi:group I intron endonuclease